MLFLSKKSTSLIVLALVLHSINVLAFDTKNIFHARAVVPLESSTIDAKTIAPILSEVLTKVTATNVVIPYNLLTQNEIDSLLASYDYSLDTDNNKFLNIVFEPKKIASILNKMQLTALSIKRPVVLIWLNIRHFDADDDLCIELRKYMEQAIANMLNKFAIPYVFPMYDLSEQAMMANTEGSMPNSKITKMLAQKYDADEILMGNINIQISNWYANWQMHNSNKQWRRLHINRPDIVNDAISTLVFNLKSKFVVNQKVNNSDVIITVKKVTTAKKIAKLLEYFNSLPQVNSAVPYSLDTDEATFMLDINTNKNELQQVLLLDKVLLATAISQENLASDSDFIFRAGNV